MVGGRVAAAGIRAEAAWVEGAAVAACETGFLFAVFADKDLAAHEGCVGEGLDCALGFVAGGEFDDATAFGHAVGQHEDLCMQHFASCRAVSTRKKRADSRINGKRENGTPHLNACNPSRQAT